MTGHKKSRPGAAFSRIPQRDRPPLIQITAEASRLYQAGGRWSLTPGVPSRYDGLCTCSISGGVPASHGQCDGCHGRSGLTRSELYTNQRVICIRLCTAYRCASVGGMPAHPLSAIPTRWARTAASTAVSVPASRPRSRSVLQLLARSTARVQHSLSDGTADRCGIAAAALPVDRRMLPAPRALRPGMGLPHAARRFSRVKEPCLPAYAVQHYDQDTRCPRRKQAPQPSFNPQNIHRIFTSAAVRLELLPACGSATDKRARLHGSRAFCCP